MRLLISDANILIDMEEGQLIEQMFHLPWTFVALHKPHLHDSIMASHHVQIVTNIRSFIVRRADRRDEFIYKIIWEVNNDMSNCLSRVKPGN